MKKLLIVILFLFTLTVTNAGVLANYDTPIKIKLNPSDEFSIKVDGHYQLINLDNNESLKASEISTFSLVNNAIVMEDNNREISSVKGFEIQEVVYSNMNSLTVNNVKQGSVYQVTEYRGSMQILVEQNKLALYNTLDIEDYIRGVVPREMPASWSKEALKAQAVAARNYAYVTFARNGYLVDTTLNQVYSGKSGEHANSNAAVDETRGVYILAGGKKVESYFHSSSGGHTENSEHVWKNQLSYIRAVEDTYDNHRNNPHSQWTTTIATETIEKALFPDNDVSLLSLEVTKRTAAGGVQQVKAIGFSHVTGEEVELLLPRANETPDRLRSIFGSSLKSIKFDIKGEGSAPIKLINEQPVQISSIEEEELNNVVEGNEASINSHTFNKENGPVEQQVLKKIAEYNQPVQFIFTGKGWGHGLGMSQWGARGMAEAGFTYEQILKHYFTGVELSKQTAAPTPLFRDVPFEFHAYPHIMALYEAGIIQGYSETQTFKPHNPVTRYQAAAMLIKALNIPLSEWRPVFVDIPADHWAAGVAVTAYDAGIFKGDNGQFKPGEQLERRHMAAILNNVFKFQDNGSQVADFPDVDKSHWTYESIRLLRQNGITEGNNGLFLPHDTTSRAHFSVFLHKSILLN